MEGDFSTENHGGVFSEDKYRSWTDENGNYSA